MRTTKIMTFSVPPATESTIQKYAKLEHRTVSEFLREAVRRYIAIMELETISRKGKKLSSAKKLKASMVDSWVNEERNEK